MERKLTRYRRKRFNDSFKLLFGILFFLTLLISVGYAALISNLSISGNIIVSGYVEPIIDTYSNRLKNTFLSDTYNTKIKTVTFQDSINVPDDAVISWDIGVAQNGNVMAYLVANSIDNTKYDLYIQGDEKIIANQDSSRLFYELKNLDSINGLEKLDTSNVKNMSSMFYSTGYNSSEFTLDLGDKFDTSKVTDMKDMFQYTGYSSLNFFLDLGDKFDTTGVTNMSGMFDFTGHSSPIFTLDLGDKFDTSNVTDMSNMFTHVGYSSTVFNLDLGDKFYTSNVKYMTNMFDGVGYSNTSFVFDLGDHFDTSSVTIMAGMFANMGYNSTIFTLDLGDNFDTSNVTKMGAMFAYTGYKSSIFTLNFGDKFDTSKVMEMNGSVFTKPSNVFSAGMFQYTGYNNSNLELDLSTFDFSKVTSYNNMFIGIKTTGKIWVKDADDQAWVISHRGTNTNLTTSNVLIKT